MWNIMPESTAGSANVKIQGDLFSSVGFLNNYIEGLVHERRNSSASAI